MKRFKWLALGVAGVVLPVVLVFSAYLIASGSIGAANAVPPVPQNRVSEESAPSPTPTQSTDRSGSGGAADDQSGRCSEPEHVNDDSCVSGSDSSGSGSNSGKGGGDDSPNSGPGSDSSGSGKGSGDD
jgi:hypothetical protein